MLESGTKHRRPEVGGHPHSLAPAYLIETILSATGRQASDIAR